MTTQGVSYTLSTLTVPTLLTLPSASAAARGFKSLTASARTHLSTLASVSSAAFLLAFTLSPRSARHPYLFYTSGLVLLSRAVVSDRVAPYLFAPAPTSPFSQQTTSTSTTTRTTRTTTTTRRMEMSYDMIGSDAHSEGNLDSASDRSIEDANEPIETTETTVNGEEVRGEVEGFLKKQVVSTALSSLAFVMAIVGIWGDYASADVLVIEI